MRSIAASLNSSVSVKWSQSILLTHNPWAFCSLAQSHQARTCSTSMYSYSLCTTVGLISGIWHLVCWAFSLLEDMTITSPFLHKSNTGFVYSHDLRSQAAVSFVNNETIEGGTFVSMWHRVSPLLLQPEVRVFFPLLKCTSYKWTEWHPSSLNP